MNNHHVTESGQQSTVNSQLSRTDGFTLAELLVSVSIIVIFSAVLLPSLGRFGRRNELNQGAQFVQSKILEARAYSLAPLATDGMATIDQLKIVEYEIRAPLQPTPPPSQSSFFSQGSCIRDFRHFAIGEVRVQDDGLRSGGSGYGRLVSCEILPSGIEFTRARQNATFSVQDQGVVTEPVPPPDITWTIRHPRLTEDNCRDIVLRKVTVQVTVESPYTC